MLFGNILMIDSGSFSGIIYLFGGDNGGNPMDTVEAYDPANDSWQTGLAPIPTERQAHDLAVVNGVIYAIGGIGGGIDGLTTNEAYTPPAP